MNLCVMRLMLKREKFSSLKKHGRMTQMFCKLFAWDMLVTNPEWTISSVWQRQPERRWLGVYETPHSLRGSTNIPAMFSLDFTHRRFCQLFSWLSLSTAGTWTVRWNVVCSEAGITCQAFFTLRVNDF
jgi:hypothetical protein